MQVSTTNVVSPGQYIMYRCPSATSPIRIGVSAIASGWQWAYVFSTNQNLPPPAFSSLSWQTSGLGDSSASGSVSTAYFFLSPLASSLPGATGAVTVDIKRPNSAIQYTSVLSTVRLVTTADFQLACTPASTALTVPGSQAVTCTLSAPSIASTAAITVSVPAVSTAAGWTATAPSPATGTVTQAAPFSFSFNLTSSCAASTAAQPVTITTNLSMRGTAVIGPSTSVAVSRSSATTVNAVITASNLNWSRPYSFTAYPNNTGTLTYTVQATGCGGWNITISASPYAYSGISVASAIPASNLALTGSTTPAGTGLSRPVTAGALNAPIKVLSASVNNGIGTFTQTLDLNLTIPAGTPVGTYRSTVTVSSAVGP